MSHNILLVEDDLNLGFLLMDFLESEGYAVKLCRDGESGMTALKKQIYDLCIFDIMMPNMDGFSLAVQLRRTDKQTPFLFLTAKSLKEDKLKGYALGAEDFITKPFDEQELLCKIQVILRRNQTENGQHRLSRFTLGNYEFDFDRQELIYKGEARRITEKESEVLRLLCLHKNRILRRDHAVREIYGQSDYFMGRSFDVFISRVRKLLKDDPRISIENVFKVGFILNVQEEEKEEDQKSNSKERERRLIIKN